MSACKESSRPGSTSVKAVAESWRVSKSVLSMAKYAVKSNPEAFDTLFEGNKVHLTNTHGSVTRADNIPTIYSTLK